MQQQPDKPKISCIILAGGRGKRFNHEDKGLVTLDDKPLIEHTIDHIASQVDDIVISANRNIVAYKKYSDKVISDRDQSFSGPLHGISACLAECEHERILIIPCDMPVLPDDLVEKLDATENDTLSIAKVYDREQLVFLMHKSLEDKLNDFLQQGHQKVMTWIALQNPDVVIFENHNAEFTNINTADELTALEDEKHKN